MEEEQRNDTAKQKKECRAEEQRRGSRRSLAFTTSSARHAIWDARLWPSPVSVLHDTNIICTVGVVPGNN